MDPILDQPGFVAHLRGYFGPTYMVTQSSPGPELAARAPLARVLKAATAEKGDPVQYFTYGLNALPASEGAALEYVLVAPTTDATYVTTLEKLIHFCVDKNQLFEPGDTILLGRPWSDGARMDRFLVSLPHAHGPKLEVFTGKAGRKGHILWLQPIHESEHAFLDEHGMAALENRFEHAGIDMFAADRDPVA